MSGSSIQSLQKQSGTRVDGKKGPKSSAALKNLQQQKGLKADGKVGPKTLAATDQAKISGEARSSAPSGDVPNFASWAKPSTRATQKALGIAADGKEGPDTTAAIKAFQKEQGVKQDGVLGPETQPAPDVRSIQQKMGLPVDGIAGPKTF